MFIALFELHIVGRQYDTYARGLLMNSMRPLIIRESHIRETVVSAREL